MKIQRLLGPAAMALAFACAGLKETRPTALRELPQPDVARCYQAASGVGNPNLQGNFEVDQYVDDKGDVPAAWIHHDVGVKGGTFFQCLLAQALADSNGDSNRAKELAKKAIELKPESEATHEAMIHACLAAKDDKCAFDEFDLAKAKPDLDARRRELASIQDQVKEAAERLQSGAQQQEEKQKSAQEAAAGKSDPTGCRKLEDNSDAQLLCLIKRCFEQGAREYAKELKPLTGQDYSAGEWKVAKHSGSKAQVTVPIRAGSAAKA